MGQKRRAEETYESDGGFIEDAPRSKKSKAVAKSSNLALEKQKDDEGNVYWEISRSRRVQISEFKGTTMVGIREFYEKDGKSLPGKKGISLSLEQFSAVVELLPQLEKELHAKGLIVPRPAYSSAKSSGPDEEKDEADEEEEAEEEAPVPKRSKSKLDKFTQKANHEATSDEDDG